jgi:signal transduction histidine kinase
MALRHLCIGWMTSKHGYCWWDFDEIPVICGTSDELREVFTNLIFNAVDAMPQGGRIFFRSREVGKHIRLEMSDTGIGMSEETLRNCMEAFFRTKGKRGSGLGLAMSYRSVV